VKIRQWLPSRGSSPANVPSFNSLVKPRGPKPKGARVRAILLIAEVPSWEFVRTFGGKGLKVSRDIFAIDRHSEKIGIEASRHLRTIVPSHPRPGP
jgi:hypothetical protein